MSESGTLYIVATPIGNLEDITLRALRILREADLVAAEDTRVTAKLLARYDITTPTTSYHQHTTERKSEHLLQLLSEGKTIALVSDAGMPGISDPGHELIRDAIEQGIRVEPIPGASAVVTALVVSGLPTAKFSFEGFPPRAHGERISRFEALRYDTRTLLFYESPNRLIATLKDMHQVMANRRVAVGRELTKLHEEVVRGTLPEVLAHFTETKPRGEIVIILEGAGAEESAPAEEQWTTLSVEEHLRQLMGEGMTQKEAIRLVSQLRHLPKREVYALALSMKEE